MKIDDISNARRFNARISMVKDSIVPQNLLYIFCAIFVKGIFVHIF